MNEPVLVALLFADRVITENNGKKGIIGTFNRFFSKSFPITFPPWSIYAAITNLSGQHTFNFILTNTESGKEIFPIKGTFDVKEQIDVVELTFNIVGAAFDSEGKYVLSCYIDDELLGSRILIVSSAMPGSA